MSSRSVAEKKEILGPVGGRTVIGCSTGILACVMTGAVLVGTRGVVVVMTGVGAGLFVVVGGVGIGGGGGVFAAITPVVRVRRYLAFSCSSVQPSPAITYTAAPGSPFAPRSAPLPRSLGGGGMRTRIWSPSGSALRRAAPAVLVSGPTAARRCREAARTRATTNYPSRHRRSGGTAAGRIQNARTVALPKRSAKPR